MKILRPWLAALFLLTAVGLSHGQTLTKLFDFSGATGDPWNPYDTPTVVGQELWFTTQNGGETGFGTLAKFNLTTNTLTTVLGAMGNATGNTPLSSFTTAGNHLYYTTSRGGTGDRGTISSWNLTSSVNTVLFNSLASGSSPNQFPGSVTYYDRGNGTASLYAMYQGGGTSPGIGGIQRVDIDIATQAVLGTTLVHSFAGGTTHGRQPFEGFTQVGTKLYFTTFTGGTAATGYANGAGTLGVLDLADDTVNDAFALLPGGDGSTAFPSHNPAYDALTNALYFTTAGTSTQPGALVKFSLQTNELTTLYELTGAATSSGPFPDGRFSYGSVTVVDGKVFFTTIQGGANNSGTINQFDLATNTLIKLFDLDSSTGNNFGGETRGGFAVIADETGYHLYLTPRQGGVNDKGTILRLDVVPEPGSALLLGCGALVLGWTRRRTAPAGK